jgi:ferredoxin--NADP+ reductase
MVKAPSGDIREVVLSFQKELSPGIFLLGFPRDRPFEAGQVIGVGLAPDGPRRLYSICSGEEDDEIHILYNVVDEGFLTPRLSGLKTGTSLWVTEARGEFVCREEKAVWVAAGTGIAPFYSMLLSGRARGKILLHGERSGEQFHFLKEFTAALDKDYIPCCSGEMLPGFYHGRVTGYLQDHPLPAVGLKYYLCGNAEMVVDTRDILIARGIPFDQIISEIYF